MSKAFFFFIFCHIFLVNAQNDSITAQGFKIPEYDKDGKLSCIISGKKGEVFGKDAKIEYVIVQIHNENNPLTLTSPKCNYNMTKKTCSSNENVVIKSDGVKITGVGFDIDNQKKNIFIRSQVKVVWKKAKLQNMTDKKSQDKVKK